MHKSDSVTEAEKMLSLEEKIDLIDCEMHTLLRFCHDNGYRTDQLCVAAQPFLRSVREEKYVRYRRFFKLVAKVVTVCIILIGILLYIPPVYRYYTFVYRKTLISLLPYWDWTKIAERQCLLYNHDYKATKIYKDDCVVCEGFAEIPRLSNVSSAVISETYLRGDLPVIVTDGMHDWDARHLSLSTLHEFYQRDIIRDHHGCLLSSNIRVRGSNHHALLHKVTSGEVTNFYAHWENCVKLASKVFRLLYHRPYFLPPMVELDDTNWVFISRGFHAKVYKEVDTLATMLIFAQVTGEFEVSVTAKQPCDATCDKLTTKLSPGEMLIVPNFLWLLDYLPFGDEENIAIGISGNFD